MKIFVIGGTGYLGQAAIQAYLERSHEAVSLSRSKPAGFEPIQGVTSLFSSLESISDERLANAMRGCDALLMAAGADDRDTVKGPVYDHFYKNNVANTERLLRLCRELRIRRVVLLGSYFSYLHAQWPELNLAHKHPYIKSRVEQEKICESYQGPDLKIVLLQLPFIFGIGPNRDHFLSALVKSIVHLPVLPCADGGTAMITLRQAAQAIVGATFSEDPPQKIAVGGVNMQWVSLLKILFHAIGMKKRIVLLSESSWKFLMFFYSLKQKISGIGLGLQPVSFVDIYVRNAYIDPGIAEQALGVCPDRIEDAIIMTAQECLVRHKGKAF